ncbi:GtrA family protein [Actinocorallia sp. A-T 12471]|uniref:GtrA family protein n=1 Tax=Actinocorallia sp. A-T 12471 TaxID=3089813 RepID=UPI0029D3F538|nr:GtrA family protein [Actinocorallia sp. A-T 12471]MDX6744662.1 GtrA family protein [Actinocorallia sp. A-T 12471]
MHRYRNLFGELARFGSVGVICVAVNYVLFNLFHFGYGMGALTANSLAMLASTTLGFLASRYWTFRGMRTTGIAREYTLFFVMNGVGYVITQAVLALADAMSLQGKLWSNIALTVGIGLATVFRYWGYKRWVFTGAEAGSEGEPGPRPAVKPTLIQR